MPVALVVLLLDITLIYHASKTGRLQPWAFIILMIPLVGALAYIVVELVPEWFGSPGAQQARKRIAGKLDPEKLYRELSDRLANTDTVANRAALAAECLRLARFDEAVRHYDHILMLPLGGEPAYALGRAQAEFGRSRPAEALATLDDLQKRWPDFELAEAHLLYARSLAEVGRIDEALEEYYALVPVRPRCGGTGPLRHAAAHGRPRRRGQSGVQRTAASDEARAQISARGAGGMAVDRRKAIAGLSLRKLRSRRMTIVWAA